MRDAKLVTISILSLALVGAFVLLNLQVEEPPVISSDVIPDVDDPPVNTSDVIPDIIPDNNCFTMLC